MKKSVVLFFVVISLFSSTIFAQSALDVRMEYESWNSGINGKTSALLYGLGGSTKLNSQWSLSGGFVTGDYSFSDSTKSTASRNDIDLALAYNLMERVRLYAGYRLIKIDYKNEIDNTRSFTDTTHGLGVGVAAYQLIMPKLYGIGRFGLSLLSSSIDFPSSDDSGMGFGSGIELGLLYQVLETTNVGLSVKQQGIVINYEDDSSKWNHNYLRLGLSLSHTF